MKIKFYKLRDRQRPAIRWHKGEHWLEITLIWFNIIWQVSPSAEGCCYCPKKADGAMLVMGDNMAHADCVIRKLNELLDPDWFMDSDFEPLDVVGFLVKAQELPLLSDEEMEQHRFFGLHSTPIPMLHVEAISKAQRDKDAGIKE